MNIAILKYNAGNTKSVCLALERIGVLPVITDDPELLRSANKVIIPGVGAARPAMDYLRTRNLDILIKSLTQPVLGICLGQQLFCQHSEEDDVECLGIFPLNVKRFKGAKKVPHMGWNTLTEKRGELFKDLPDEIFAYFIHSYRVPPSQYTIARSQYGEIFSAGLQKDNFYALQFHPEKSGPIGSQILKNFIEL